MYQCGIPKEMALELFKPHFIHWLVSKDIAHNIKAAKRLIDNQDPVVWDLSLIHIFYCDSFIYCILFFVLLCHRHYFCINSILPSSVHVSG